MDWKPRGFRPMFLIVYPFITEAFEVMSLKLHQNSIKEVDLAQIFVF